MDTKIIQRSKSFDFARNILNNQNEDYKTEVLQSLYIKLEEIAAAKYELKKAREKLLYIAANTSNDDLQRQCNLAWQAITKIDLAI